MLNRKTRLIGVVVAAAIALLCLPALAQELTAEQIIGKSQENRQVDNSIQTLTMELFDRQGRSRVRKITSKIKKGADGNSMSYVRFEEPEDVAGVQFLTRENAGAEDDQFLYMPAGDILNRISGSSKKGSFMGSDFSFEDLSVGSPEDGTHKLLPEETITVAGASHAVYVVETVPKPELSSAYSKLVTYIAKADFVPRQVLFFDTKGNNIKKMSITEVKKDGDSLIPVNTIMENLKRGTKTVIHIDEYQTAVPPEQLPDSMFTEAYLRSEG